MNHGIPPSSPLDNEPPSCFPSPVKIIGEEIDWSVPLSRYQYVTDGNMVYQIIGMIAYNDSNPIYLVRTRFGSDIIFAHSELANLSERRQYNMVVSQEPT